MKFTIHLLLIALIVALAYAATEQKQVIVSYPKDTPDSVVENAMAAIKEAVINRFAFGTPLMYRLTKQIGRCHHPRVQDYQGLCCYCPCQSRPECQGPR